MWREKVFFVGSLVFFCFSVVYYCFCVYSGKPPFSVEERVFSTPSPSPLVVNINEADLDDLVRLSGIGKKKAEKILEYRSIHGFFKRKEDIKKVWGIDDKLYKKIEKHICVE